MVLRSALVFLTISRKGSCTEAVTYMALTKESRAESEGLINRAKGAGGGGGGNQPPPGKIRKGVALFLGLPKEPNIASLRNIPEII